MALDLTLPATGITKHGELYRVLRDNFNGINDKYTPTKYSVSLTPGVVQVATDPVCYYVDGAGYVHLFGSVTVAVTPNIDIPFFVLPPGHRPDIEYYINNRIYYINNAAPLGGGDYSILVLRPYDDSTKPGAVDTFLNFAYNYSLACSFNGIVFKGM